MKNVGFFVFEYRSKSCKFSAVDIQNCFQNFWFTEDKNIQLVGLGALAVGFS